MRLVDPSPTHADLDAYGAQGRSAWLDIDWREHQRWVTLSGGPVNLIDIGPADSDQAPVLFVHGLSGCWQNWLENIPAFAQDRRVVAVDLPGFGASPMPSQDITISSYANALDELMGALDIEAASVVGNSMGGFVAAELAIRHPQRVERMVLVAAAGIGVAEMRNDRAMAVLKRGERIVLMGGAFMAANAARLSRRARLRRAAMAAVAAHPDRLSPPLVAEQISGSAAPGFLAALDALTSYDFEDRLPEIACPTLIYWGTKDRLVPVRHSKRFNELIENSRRIVLEDTGHVPMLERPARFNSDLEAFLEEDPGERVGATESSDQRDGAL
jgi:pimeloyl-ACP methyl ester carboxylesterase